MSSAVGVQQDSLLASENKDVGNVSLSEKTRYTLLVTQAADSFINSFIVVCSTRFKSQISQKVHPDTIRGALSSVNLDEVLGAEEVHQVFKRCYGVKQWLLAPEEGTRGVLKASLQLYEAPLRQILVEMHGITLEAAKLAMKTSAKTASRGQGGIKNYSLADDAVRQLLLNQAENLVEQWRDQTWEQLRRNLHAEAEFPAPERFAKLKSRLQELLGAEAAKQAARQNEEYKRMLLDTLNQLQSTTTLKSHPLPLANSLPPSPSGKAAAKAAPARAVVKEEPPSWSEFFMGWLMKENRHGLFQRRWFALSIRQQKLWYFADPEEVPARGTGHLVGAKIISLVDAAQEEDELYEDSETKQQKTFRIVFSTEADQPRVGALPIPLEAQKAVEGLTGQRTKTLTTELILRAASVASKNQWCEMLNKAIIGVPEPPKVEAAATVAAGAGAGGLGVSLPVGQVSSLSPDPFVEDKIDSTHVGRKISTKIFKENEEESKKTVQDKNNKKKASITSSDEEEKRSPTTESHDSEEEEEDEEARVDREIALFDEIAAQTEYAATPEEKAVLECVSLAVREYIVDALGYLTEQASRIIADGMLPLSRAEELHSTLLRVLITGREGGLTGWTASEFPGAGEFSSDTEN